MLLKYFLFEISRVNSWQILSNLAKDGKLDEPCLFWLDGHYSAGGTAKGSKETPILEELKSIFTTHKKHVILIDDARCFIGENDYPAIEALKSFIKNIGPNYKITLESDIIILIPQNKMGHLLK